MNVSHEGETSYVNEWRIRFT